VEAGGAVYTDDIPQSDAEEVIMEYQLLLKVATFVLCEWVWNGNV